MASAGSVRSGSLVARVGMPVAAFICGLLLGALLIGRGPDASGPQIGHAPTSFPRTERGVADAAAAYSSLVSPEGLGRSSSVREAVGEVMTPELAEQATPALEQSLETIEAARRRGFGPATASGPLNVDVLAFDENRATVRMLSAVVVGAPTQPLQIRVTEERPELVWEGDRWLIAGGEPPELVSALTGTRAQARTFVAALGDAGP